MSDPDAAARCIFPADMRQLHDFQKLTLVVARAVHGKGATGIAHIAETFAVAQPHMDTGHRNNRHRLNSEAYSCCGSATQGHRAEDQQALRSEHLLWLSCAGTQGKGAAGIAQVQTCTPAVAQPCRDTGHRNNRHQTISTCVQKFEGTADGTGVDIPARRRVLKAGWRRLGRMKRCKPECVVA